MTNVDPNNDVEVRCEIRGAEVSAVTAAILTADEMTAHNGFGEGQGRRVRPVEFDGATVDGTAMAIAMPAKSIVALELS